MDVPTTQARAQVRLYNTSGALQAVFDDWRTLELQRRVGTYDLLTFGIDGADSRIPLFTLDSIIEVWRKLSYTGAQWYREATLFHRTPSRQITERGTRIYTSYSRGLNDLLRRREIAYPASTTFTLKGGVAETVMKQYVEENAGPSALASLTRAANGAFTGFTVEPSAGRGAQWAGQRSYQNLLDVLQEISGALTSVDFDVVRTDVPGSGAATFEFRCYYPQLGTDRSATVKFATLFGNMQNPFYTLSRTDEVNRAIVLGAGQDSARRILTQDSVYTIDSPWNVIEKSQDSRQEDTLTGLIAAANAVLESGKPQEQFTFAVLQTAAYQYGRDYFLGDIVSAAFDSDISTTKKITGVTLNISEGKEDIQVTFSDVPLYS